VKKKLTCPVSAHLEEIEYTERAVDGHILGITRCSALDRGDVEDCGQVCIELLNAREDYEHPTSVKLDELHGEAHETESPHND